VSAWSLCSVRVSCRCVWLIGAEVRKQGCGHLLIIGWKLLYKHSGGGRDGWLGRKKYLREISASCNLIASFSFLFSFTKCCVNIFRYLFHDEVFRERRGGCHLSDASFNKDWGNLSN